MSKAVDMAKVSAKGSFHLLWGLIVSTLISSIGTIFVARLLGSDLFGLYGIVLTVPMLIAIFRDWGVNSAIVRCAAQYRAEGRADEIRSIFISGLIFEIILGLALSIISFVFSGFLAASVFHRPEIAPLIQLASISILANGLINSATAAFTGVERMELNSIMIICQSIFKTFVTIALVVWGLGAAGAVIGYTAAMLISGLIGVLFMMTLYKRLPKSIMKKLEIRKYLKIMLAYGTPLSFSTILSSFQVQFFAFLLPIHYATDNTAIGNYTIASTFIVLITFFATPIGTMLFPAFSKLDPQKDRETLQNVFQFSVKYAALIVVPVSALVMCIAEPAVSTLFGNTYSTAPLFLALLAIVYLSSAFGSLSVSNFINGQGKTRFNLYLNMLTASIGFPLGYSLIMLYGVIGLIIATILCGLPSFVISLYWIKKHYYLTVDWVSSVKILFSALFTASLTYGLISQLSVSNFLELAIGGVFFVIVFIFTALITRAVNKYDLSNLRSITSGMGSLSGVLGRILNIIEKIMSILRL